MSDMGSHNDALAAALRGRGAQRNVKRTKAEREEHKRRESVVRGRALSGLRVMYPEDYDTLYEMAWAELEATEGTMTAFLARNGARRAAK